MKYSAAEKVAMASAKEILTTEEVQLLYSIGKTSLMKLIEERAFRVYRVNGTGNYRIKKSDIEEWLLRYPVESQEAMASQAAAYYKRNN